MYRMTSVCALEFSTRMFCAPSSHNAPFQHEVKTPIFVTADLQVGFLLKVDLRCDKAVQRGFTELGGG